MNQNSPRKISIYLKNAVDSPSAYYCIMQYIERLPEFKGEIKGLWPNQLFRLFMKPIFRHGIGSIFRKGVLFLIQVFNILRYMLRDIYVYRPEVVVICRELFPQYMPRCFAGIYKKFLTDCKLIWTFDDNIKMGEISKREWDILCKYADEIMVTHDYLKDTLPEELKEKISYIPQADGDIEKLVNKGKRKNKRESYEKSISLIWVATSVNLPNMYYISEQLEMAATKLKLEYNKELVLRVVCNEKYVAQHKYLKVKNILWSRQGAAEMIESSHIGIMPLIDSEYSRGKGGFKLVQYMTANLPVIASEVGWNKVVVGEAAGILVNDIRDKAMWIKSIIELSTDYQLWEKMSEGAHARCLERFSFEKNLLLWKNKLGV